MSSEVSKSKAQIRKEIQEKDPERYRQIKEEQQRLLEECPTTITVTRTCPYCGHKLGEIFRGQHGYMAIKCNCCGEMTIFPPICFRLAR